MDRLDELIAEVVEMLPAGVFALDGDGRVLVWNAEAERLTGWKRDDVVGHDLTGCMLDMQCAGHVADGLGAGRSFAGRLPAAGATGRGLRFRAAPGPASMTVGVLYETTDTVAPDEASALLDALWETAPVGLAVVDRDLRYQRVNSAILEMGGGTAEERLGRTLEEVHGPVGARTAKGLREVLVEDEVRRDLPVRGRLWHGRGPARDWRMSGYPVHGPDGGIVGVGVVVDDVTCEARARRELVTAAAQREHALNRYQSLVEASSAAVWIRSADGSAVRDAPGLRAITGQSVAEHRGWGFLDAVHPAHRPAVEAAWRAAATTNPAGVFMRAYRLRTAAGGYRWFRMRAVPVYAGGHVVEWVGTETDIDDAMRARDRLDVLAQATFAMNAALDPEAELEALADAVVPEFADLCRVYLLDPDPLGRPPGDVTGRRSITRTAPGLPSSPSSAQRFTFAPDHPIARCAHTVAPVLVDVRSESTARWRAPEAQQRWGLAIGVNSMLVAPVVARGSVMAALLFIAGGDRPPYTEDDLALVGELATRASAAVETAVTYQQSREASVTLQSAMLSTPPEHPGVEIEARYLPAAAELRVGGDWYDAFPLPGGDLALGVGDVAGHDLPAAATMGQLRSMLRGLAHDSDGAPSEVLCRLDRVACGLDITSFTTLLYGRLSRTGGRTVFRWSSAGHPAPILLPPHSRPTLLGRGVDVVLGVDPAAQRRDHEVELVPGARLLLYTDGLFECRDDPDDTAGMRLLDLVHGGADLRLPEFCDHLVRATTADTGDDIVVLALRVAA